MRGPHTEKAITDGRREAPIGEMNIAGRKEPTLTTASTIGPMKAIGTIIGGMHHTPTAAKITGEKMDTSTEEDLRDLSTTCNLSIPDI